MITRREFAQMSAIGAGLMTLPAWAGEGAASRRIDYFLLEPDAHPRSARDWLSRRNFAMNVREIHHADLSAFWFEMQPLLAGAPLVLAGLTSGHSAFLMAQLAQDYGYGMVAARRTRDPWSPDSQGAGVLSPIELNTAQAVHWQMAKTGAAFR